MLKEPKMQKNKSLLAKAALLISLLLPAGPAAMAGPQDGRVAAGQASIEQSGPVTDIRQGSDRAVINWNSFDIGRGETVNHQMPRAESAGLHRVVGGHGASQLEGALNSNGNVYLVNPKGVVIHDGARINTGGFVATTHDIGDEDFIGGDLNFGIRGEPGAAVVNGGEISVRESGYAALVAPTVRNDGVIAGRLANVALASGDGFKLDVYGDNLVNFNVTEEQAAGYYDLEGVRLGVENTGRITAEGGVVLLTARQLGQAVSGSINNSGVIEASSAELDGGEIVFRGQGEIGVVNIGTITASSEKGDGGSATLVSDAEVVVSGRVEAVGAGLGGRVDVSGRRRTTVEGAEITADGRDGGLVRLGGEYQGGRGPSGPSDRQWDDFTGRFGGAPGLSPAGSLRVDASSAVSAGVNGTVIAWSDGRLEIGSALRGKFVETSGRELGLVTGPVITAAGGLWLIDPPEIHVGPSYAPAGAGVCSFSGDVAVSSLNDCLSQPNMSISLLGDYGLIVDAGSTISWSQPNGLALQSDLLIIESNVSFNNSAGGEVVFAPKTYSRSSTLYINSGVSVTTSNFHFYDFAVVNVEDSFTINFVEKGEFFSGANYTVTGNKSDITYSSVTIDSYFTVNGPKKSENGGYFRFWFEADSVHISNILSISTGNLSFNTNALYINSIGNVDVTNFVIKPYSSSGPATFELGSGGSIFAETFNIEGPYSRVDFGTNAALNVRRFELALESTPILHSTIDFRNLYIKGDSFSVNTTGPVVANVTFADGSKISMDTDVDISLGQQTAPDFSELKFVGKTETRSKYINLGADRIILQSNGAENYPMFEASRLIVVASYDQSHQVKLESNSPQRPVFSAESVVITNGNFLLNPYAIKTRSFSWFDGVELYGKQVFVETKAPHIFDLNRLLLNDITDMFYWPFEKNEVYIAYGPKNYYNLYLIDMLVAELRYKKTYSELSGDVILDYGKQILQLKLNLDLVKTAEFNRAYEILTNKEFLEREVRLEVSKMLEMLYAKGDIKFGSDSIYQFFTDKVSMYEFLEEYLTIYLIQQKVDAAINTLSGFIDAIDDKEMAQNWLNAINNAYTLYDTDPYSLGDAFKDAIKDSALLFVDALTIVWETKDDIGNLFTGGLFGDAVDNVWYAIDITFEEYKSTYKFLSNDMFTNLVSNTKTTVASLDLLMKSFTLVSLDTSDDKTTGDKIDALISQINSIVDLKESFIEYLGNDITIGEAKELAFLKQYGNLFEVIAALSDLAQKLSDYKTIQETIVNIETNPNFINQNESVTYIVSAVSKNDLFDSLTTAAIKIADCFDENNFSTSAVNIINKAITDNNALGRMASKIKSTNEHYQFIWDYKASEAFSDATTGLAYSALPADLLPRFRVPTINYTFLDANYDLGPPYPGERTSGPGLIQLPQPDDVLRP
jgi:filamentous hemagglutinin family protein